ncbi:MAG TPA: choice-of-anchor Q domain-containing protein [Solirubrobacteraceae bacterium]|nr:choice-of-anchor Q domain-containing protein [Solirubrobacteraceae bacterium]
MRINLFRGCRSALKLMVAVACLGMLATSAASAETFKVSTSKQLEEAVTKANANGVPNTIELTAGAYLPSKSLVFTNTGGVQTVAGPAGTVGVATPGVQVNGGSVTPVGGVSEHELFLVNEGVTVTLKHVVVTSGGESGGSPGIEDRGTLDIENATISGNLGTEIFVESGATANLTNSTLSDGHEFGLVDEGTASFLNVTVVHNASGGVGGTGSGTVNLTNTIVGLNGAPQCGSNTITNDHSLASDASCGGEAQFQNKTPLLQSSLLNDGGSTTLYSEKAGSPTIDAGDPAKCPATDQRGYPRPDVGGTGCDIGADEYSPTPPHITVPAEIVTPATSASGAVVTYSVEATDSDALVKSLSCLPASGATFPVGTTKVECTAVDGHENKATASFNVTVTAASPVVSSVVPDEGPEAGGTTVTIRGEHLEGATEAKFGATAATELKVVSGTEITVKDPAHTAGTIDVTVKTSAGTSTTSNNDHFTYQASQATSPEAKLRDLLQEVRSSNIQHQIRNELSCLLSDALHSLGGLSGYEHSKCGTGFLSSRVAAVKADRRKSKQSGACEYLEQFVDVIGNDQGRARPKIPAKLATAWSRAAYEIETSLGCMRHGRQSSRHPSLPVHGQRRGHRSGGR